MARLLTLVDVHQSTDCSQVFSHAISCVSERLQKGGTRETGTNFDFNHKIKRGERTKFGKRLSLGGQKLGH